MPRKVSGRRGAGAGRGRSRGGNPTRKRALGQRTVDRATTAMRSRYGTPASTPAGARVSPTPGTGRGTVGKRGGRGAARARARVAGGTAGRGTARGVSPGGRATPGTSVRRALSGRARSPGAQFNKLVGGFKKGGVVKKKSSFQEKLEKTSKKVSKSVQPAIKLAKKVAPKKVAPKKDEKRGRIAKKASSKSKKKMVHGGKVQGYLDREAEMTPGRGKGVVSPRGRARMARGARGGTYGFKKGGVAKKK